MTLVINDFNLNGTLLKVKSEIQFSLVLWIIIEILIVFKLIIVFSNIYFLIFHQCIKLVINLMSFQFELCEMFERIDFFSHFFLLHSISTCYFSIGNYTQNIIDDFF
jgi:hypothetical protein